MEIPPKPKNLIDLRIEIEKIKTTQYNLLKCQEEFKSKVGLSGHTKNSLPFHPKALEAELDDLKDHLLVLQTNYIQFLTEQKWLQYALEEPIQIVDLSKLEKENEELDKKLKDYFYQIDEFTNQITILAESIETTRDNILNLTEETENGLDQINLMKDELDRIYSMISNQSKLTIEEAKKVLRNQTEEMTRLNKIVETKKDAISENQWTVEDLEEEENDLKTRAAILQRKADHAVITNLQKNKNVEEQYFVYKEFADLRNQIYGINSIDFESDSIINIVFDKPVKVTLRIKTDSNRIINATVTGDIVNIKDLTALAMQMKPNDGIRVLIFETMARLKQSVKK